MKNIYWMDEIHPTEIDFKIDFQSRTTLKQYHPEVAFSIYFVGIRIWVSWLFLNFVGLLKTILEFCKYCYVPIAHINSVGIAVEFHSQYNECMIYADGWEMGRHSRMVLSGWRKRASTRDFAPGIISINPAENSIDINLGFGKISSDLEHTYRFYKIKKSQILNVDIKHL